MESQEKAFAPASAGTERKRKRFLWPPATTTPFDAYSQSLSDSCLLFTRGRGAIVHIFLKSKVEKEVLDEVKELSCLYPRNMGPQSVLNQDASLKCFM